MRRFAMTFGLVVFALAGCTENKPMTTGEAAEKTGEAVLESLVLAQKPEKVMSVREVLDMKEGDKVIVSGQTPPEVVKPFNSAVAAVLLMAPGDLERPEIKEEFECEDAATCPACKKVLDANAIRVELVDARGAVIATSLEGFRGLKAGSIITFEGEVRRDGKDKKLVRIVAKKFYPG